MSRLKKGNNSPDTVSAAPRLLLIVARDNPRLYRAMQLVFGRCQTLTVLLDRRRKNRPRRVERRSLFHPADDPRSRQYVLVRPYSRRPHISPSSSEA